MKKIVFLFIFLTLLLPTSVLAIIGPRAYLTEQVTADYWANGTLDEPVNRTGKVELSVPNSVDVLQYIRITLSSTTDTNLQNETAYKNVLTSYPIAGSKKIVYVNTTAADPSDYYEITNASKAPTIDLSIDITNYAGGNDLFDEDNLDTSTNTLNFTLNLTNPSPTKDLTGVEAVIQFEKNTNGVNDSVNVTTVPTDGGAVGTPGREDTDADYYYDKVTWTEGTIGKGSSVFISFNLTMEELKNYPNNTNSMNLDATTDKGTEANYSQTTTLTGITFTDKFTRAPIRQGVDLAQDSDTGIWKVRGFIRNMANDTVTNKLTYNISIWRLYQVNETTGEPYETYAQNGTFTPGTLTPDYGRLYTTDAKSSNTSWYDTGSTAKPFFSSYFDWEVIWNTTNSDNYYGYINTTLDLSTLYKIDMVNDKSTEGFITPDVGGDVITITDETQHKGHSQVPGDYIQILSVVPVNTTANEFHGWFDINETSVKVYFVNATSDYELNQTGVVSTSVTDPAADGSADGSVNLTITDLASANFTDGGAVGYDLNPDEKIKLIFDVISNESMTTGDSYNFTGNSTQKTPSGTPLTEIQPTRTVEATMISITLPTDFINFGLMYPNDVNDTEDDSPQPFVIENNGTVSVNVTIKATDFWSGTGGANPSTYYRFMCGNTTEANCSAGSVMAWEDTPNSTTEILVIANLNWTDTNDTNQVEIKLNVPSDEPAGDKSSTVTFTATQA